MIDELKEYVSTHKLEEKTMTREEALKWLDTIMTQGEQVDALEMAIEALENQKTLKEELEDIKAEIQKEADYLKQQRDYGRAYGMEIAIEYIDKHIKENKQ